MSSSFAILCTSLLITFALWWVFNLIGKLNAYDKAYAHRMTILDALEERYDDLPKTFETAHHSLSLLRKIDDVTVYDHMAAIRSGKNWKDLYDKELIEIYDAYVAKHEIK